MVQLEKTFATTEWWKVQKAVTSRAIRSGAQERVKREIQKTGSAFLANQIQHISLEKEYDVTWFVFLSIIIFVGPLLRKTSLTNLILEPNEFTTSLLSCLRAGKLMGLVSGFPRNRCSVVYVRSAYEIIFHRARELFTTIPIDKTVIEYVAFGVLNYS